VRLANIERKYKRNYFRSHLLPANYDKPSLTGSKQKGKQCVVANDGKFDEVIRIYHIDKKLSKDPFDPNFEVKIEYLETYMHKVGK
jgi:hypothetical protein